MNDVQKYTKKLQTTVKLVESIIAGAVAFTVWVVSFVKTSQEEAVANFAYVYYILTNYLRELPYCAA
jgi:hypothetical protein